MRCRGFLRECKRCGRWAGCWVGSRRGWLGRSRSPTCWPSRRNADRSAAVRAAPDAYYPSMGSGASTGLLACVACGAELPATAKFCLECGAAVPAAERETRRTVTLLFTDVTGSTAMGEQLDPEAFRGVLGRYFVVARTAVERHGGTVEK